MKKTALNPQTNASSAAQLTLSTPLQYLKGVGPKLAGLLAKRELHTIGDLIQYFPRVYEDRRAARNIASLKAGDMVSLRAQIAKVDSYFMGKSRRKIFDILVRDSSGFIRCKFFRIPFKGYFDKFAPFQQVRIIGRVTQYRDKLEFNHPEIRMIGDKDEVGDQLIPVYSEIETITSAKIQRWVQACLSGIAPGLFQREEIPTEILQENQLISLAEALREIHTPRPELADLYHSRRSPAHRRLIFEEFFWLELKLAMKKSLVQKEPGLVVKSEGGLRDELQKSLPFRLTQAQVRVSDEIRKDLASGHPMYRLLQGDVGSGKTMVAFLSALECIECGLQAAFMAPTEILAEQHHQNALKMLGPLGVRSAFLSGKTKASERKEILSSLFAGEVQLLIGTHALIEDEVRFRSLGLVIIDEQHRFGVQQRAKLKEKGRSPHFLVMTATPIPRTLAMTVYGDLDLSILDELPPGRSPIQTRVVFENKRQQALDFMAEQIVKGRQAYIVYPLVEESEKVDLKNAMDEFEQLKKQFPQFRIGLMHGRLNSQEKESVMAAFRKGELQVLVSTTVIEVGVDVPNANLMLIEHAERFGLSQLHQLRGRVGRGSQKSYCIMLLGHASEVSRTRTQLMESTNDGFKIAEFDLEIRGPGEFLGTKQSGLPEFRLASLVSDGELLSRARQAAQQIVSSGRAEHFVELQELKQHQA